MTSPVEFLHKKTEITLADWGRAEQMFKYAIEKAWEAGVMEQYEFQQGKSEAFGMEGEFPHKANVMMSGANYYTKTYEK